MRSELIGHGPKKLTNDGELEIFFVGARSAFTTQGYQTSILIIKGDTHVLVDCGETGPKALAKYGIKVPDIKNLFVTHLHPDHANGVGTFGLMHRYPGVRFQGAEKPNLIIDTNFQHLLWDRTLRGGLEWCERDQGAPLTLADYFNIIRPTWKTHQPREIYEIVLPLGGENSPDDIVHGDPSEDYLKLEIFRTMHMPEGSGSWEDAFTTYGLFIDDRVLYTGDTLNDPDLISMYGEQAQAIFHDVQFFNGGVHASLEELKNTMPAQYMKKTWLMHYADNYMEQEANDFMGFVSEGVSYVADNA